MIQNKRNNICYYCGKPATNEREHVPPQCFFPKGHRKELLTVPSCKEHNFLYKMDDEYVRNILSMGLNNSGISRNLYFSKTIRSFNGNPGLVKAINKTMTTVKLEDGTITGAFIVDGKRFSRVMVKIGKGLYFYDFKNIWDIELNVYSPNVLNKNNFGNPYVKLFKKADKEFKWTKSYGGNIDVFTYKWGRDAKDALILRLRFFSNFLVYIFPHYENQQATL